MLYLLDLTTGELVRAPIGPPLAPTIGTRLPNPRAKREAERARDMRALA